MPTKASFDETNRAGPETQAKAKAAGRTKAAFARQVAEAVHIDVALEIVFAAVVGVAARAGHEGLGVVAGHHLAHDRADGQLVRVDHARNALHPPVRCTIAPCIVPREKSAS